MSMKCREVREKKTAGRNKIIFGDVTFYSNESATNAALILTTQNSFC